MILTPGKDSTTHNNNEACGPGDFRAGLDIMLHAAAERADHCAWPADRAEPVARSRGDAAVATRVS